MRTLEANDGFSVLEILLSLVIFAVIAAGLAVASIGSMKATSMSREAAVAATLVYDRVEKFRALDPSTNPADIVAGDHDDPLNPLTPLGADGGAFTRSWVVTPNVPRVGLHEVVITVQWTDYTEHSVQGTTYVCGRATCS